MRVTPHLAWLIGALCITACAGTTTPGSEPPESPLDALGLAPEGSTWMVEVDLERFRAAEGMAAANDALEGLLDEWQEDRRGLGPHFRKLFDRTDHAWMLATAVPPPLGSSELELDWVLVTQGSYDPGQIRRLLTRSDTSERLREEVRHDLRVLVLSDEVGAVRVADGFWAFCPPEAVDRLIERIRAGGSDNAALRATHDSIGPAFLRVAVLPGRYAKGYARQESFPDVFVHDQIARWTLAADASHGLDVQAVVTTREPEMAAELEKRMDAWITTHQGSDIVRTLGVSTVLEKIRTSVEDKATRARVHLSGLQLRRWVAHLERTGSRTLAALNALLTRKSPAMEDGTEAAAGKDNDVERLRVPVRGDHPARGPDDALVTVVVFSDFQCPFCERVQPTLERLKEEFGNDLRIVWRNNPLPFHERALPAAVAAMEAYEQGGDIQFWEMHDRIFARQRNLSDKSLIQHAKKMGMNIRALRRALENREHVDTIKADQKLALRLGLRGTPSFLINGRKLVGAQPYPAFEELVREELAHARRLVEQGVPREGIYAHLMKSAQHAPSP